MVLAVQEKVIRTNPSNLAQIEHQIPHCVDYAEDIHKKTDMKQMAATKWPKMLGKRLGKVSF